ncbi:MAG: YihD family protein [Psychromonas sp.]|nr:YihD family protein [Alteromonadales bacterium]MCP5076536.1 YihD family protein [Psychromonas sp.]
MNCHRINELLELLQPEWQKHGDLSLIEMVTLLAQEAGHKGSLNEITDDILIYHLKMRNSKAEDAIPGLAKDQNDDFKTALLKARNVL